MNDQEIAQKKMREDKIEYISQNRNSSDFAVILRVVRYILETPEAHNVVTWAEHIMTKIPKQNEN